MSMTILFDRPQLRRQRERAAPRVAEHDFLLTEACARLSDRLDDITHRFPLCVDLGSHHGLLARHLANHPRIGTIISCDPTAALIAQAPEPKLIADEEALPFADNSVDAVFSLLALHWVNDLPGTFAQIERILKPDGLFIALIPGGDTLHELRTALTTGEIALTGGVRPRIIPFLDVRDAGALLQRAGFALPVIDSDRITLSYATPMSLLRELRHMGQSSALTERPRHFTPPSLIAAATAHYPVDDEGRITATLDLLTLTAWKKADSQPQPARRGSGKLSLASVLTGS